MSVIEQIWARHTLEDRDNYSLLEPDFIFGHEATMSLILDKLEEFKGPKIPPQKCYFVLDHFAPPSCAQYADIAHEFKQFCRKRKIPLKVYRGIGHRLMLEDPAVQPGMLVLGADSHTCTLGGKGVLGIGLGSTDVLAALMTGAIALKKPRVTTIKITGKLHNCVEAKDIILHLAKQFGQAGFVSCYLEFLLDNATLDSCEERAVLSNMSVELGAATGVVHNCCSQNRFDVEVDVSYLQPLVALPGGLDKIRPASSLCAQQVDTVFVGSCASGGLVDLEVAAKLLEKYPAHPNVSLLIFPSTWNVYLQALNRGWIETIIKQGGVIMNPSCGPCGGIDKGIPAETEVVLSTAPRNFSSRMRLDSKVFLCSTATAVASAITGHIADPREILE